MTDGVLRALLFLSSMSLSLASCATARPPEPPPAETGYHEAPSLMASPAFVALPALSIAPPPEPDPPPILPPPGPRKPLSGTLRGGLHNPLPGGVFAGYQADTGLDIAGVRLPVHAIASGTLDYSEPGHTLWTGPRDTPNCVRVELDTPIPWKDRLVTHVYYAHLSALETLQKEGETPRRHVEAGELLGVSGVARGSPHLHIGLLLDGDTSQRYWGTFLLADEIRQLFGGYRNGDRL